MRFSPYLYISPFFLLFLVVGMFPLAYTAVVSVYDWSLIGGKGEFVGLQNYRDVLDNPYFWKSTVNTLSIFVLSSVPQIAIALGLAGLLDTALRGATFWRMGVLLPFVVAPVAVGIIFGSLFGDRYGLDQRGAWVDRTLRRPVAHRPAGQPPRHRHDGQLALDRATTR